MGRDSDANANKDTDPVTVSRWLSFWLGAAVLCAPRQVFDYESNGSHRPLGWVELSTERMIEMGAQQGAFVSLNPPRGKPPGDYGTLHVRMACSCN